MRISVTTIDKFREYINEVKNYDESIRTEEIDLINYITAPFAPSKYMAYGTAIHYILERPEECIRSDGAGEYYYKDGIVLLGTDYFKMSKYNYAEFPKEVPATKVYDYNGEKITVSAKADQLVGRTVIENKTKYSYRFTMQDYVDTYQWRFYMQVFEVPVVIYQIFFFSEAKAQDGVVLELNDIKTFRCDDYTKLAVDCENLLFQFVDWIKLHNLEKYFKDKL